MQGLEVQQPHRAVVVPARAGRGLELGERASSRHPHPIHSDRLRAGGRGHQEAYEGIGRILECQAQRLRRGIPAR